MSKKNDDNIEKFFRKAVRQQDIRFVESDWKKMEEMLDAAPALRPGAVLTNLKRAALVLTGILLLSGSIYFQGFYYQNIDQVKDSPLQKTQAAAGKEVPQQDIEDDPAVSLLSEPTSAETQLPAKT